MAKSAETEFLSRTGHVLEALRADLLESRIKPGERLKLPSLSARFGVSMTVIREALSRLAEQGLVVSNPKRGFSVMALSESDLRDLTTARVRLESMLLGDSIDFGDLEWETAVVSAHHALARTVRILDDNSINPLWLQCHREFHHALLSGCGSQRLLALTVTLRDSAELYRAWSHSLAKDIDRNVTDEHEAIMRSALDRDKERALELLTAHIERTSRVLLEYSREHPLESV